MKKLVSMLLALVMVLGAVPFGAIAEELGDRSLPIAAEEVSSAACGMADFALTQEGKTGNDYAASDGVSFDWCVWFTTYCASHNDLCGTMDNYYSNVFPPVERSTWSANNWAATGVTYQINWFAQHDKGTYYYFGVRDSRISINDNIVCVNRNSYTPQEGDLIYFDWEQDGAYNHVAIVYNYDAATNTVYYVGGNQGTEEESWPTRSVSRVAISASSEDIVGYMEPDYSISLDSSEIRGATLIYSGNGSDYTSSNQLATKLNNVFNGSVSLFSNISTKYALGSSLNINYEYCVAGWCYGYQCYAYANGVYYYLFGEVPYNGSSSYSHSTVVMRNASSVNFESFVAAGVRVGAHLRTTTKADGSFYGNGGHSLIVLYYDENYIYSLEGNWDNNGLICITKMTWGDFNSIHLKNGSRKVCFILQPTDAYYSSIGDNIDSYSLDFHGYIDGWEVNGLGNYGTVDLYINDVLVGEGITNYYQELPRGTKYEFKNIHPNANYSYDGIYSGSRKGIITGETKFVPIFTTYNFLSFTETADAIEYNGHRYLFFSTPVTWYYAKNYCSSLGGHLVTVTDAEENAFVLSLFPANTSVWMGATDYGSEGNWYWITGEPFNYCDWSENQPDNANEANNSSEDYAHFKTSGKWNDDQGDLKYAFVCEIDSPAHCHEIQYMPYSAPTCTKDGHIDYYYCTGCGKCFSDAAGENEITLAITVIPATGHMFVDEAFPATCISYAGETHTCSVCGYSYVTYLGEWSEWSTEYPEGVDEKYIESRTEYRYRDYETMTSYETSINGWIKIGSEWIQTGSGTIDYVSSWPAGFETSHSIYGTYHNTPVNATETETDKTVINSSSIVGYIYWHWCRGTYSDGPENRKVNDSRTSEFKDFAAFYSTTDPSTLEWDSSQTVKKYPNAAVCRDSWWYYYLPVIRQTYTTYSSLFTYERWTDWSDWSSDFVEASDTREVETRTVYRYIIAEPGPHQWNDGEVTVPCTHDHDGEMTYTCVLCNATYTEVIPRPDEYTLNYFVDGEYYDQQLYWADEQITLLPYTAPYGYTFSGWHLENGDPVPPAMPANDLALYGTLIPNTVTVTYTGDYVGTEEVIYGENAVLPVLDAEGLHYVFTVNGEPWDGVNVTENVTVTVTTEIDVYTVTFIDPITGEVLSVQQIEWLESAAAPAAPEHYGYTFEGWDSEFDCIEADTVIYAVYTPVSFTVIFTDGMDNIISVQEVPYLSAAEEPEIPVRLGWLFAGWDADFSCIETSMVVNATWERQYITITFTGSYTGTELVEYGADCPLPVYNSNSICYVFKVNGVEWCPENITADETVTVSVAAKKNTYHTVTFVGMNGEVISTQQVLHEQAAVAPEAPIVPGYRFVGWDRDNFDCVTYTMTRTAVYEKIEGGIPGDVDGDGQVTFIDVSILSLFLSGEGSIDPAYVANADFNGDGTVSFTDLSDMAIMLIG